MALTVCGAQRMMRIAVIGGASGQVGRSLAALNEADLRVDLYRRPDVDLTRPSTLEAFVRSAAPDIVINCGAYTAVDLAESESAAARAVNTEGPAFLATTCAAAGIPLIHLSTDYVFNGAKLTPYTEGDATSPRNVYGRTKLDGEITISASGVRHVIIRTSWVHAPEGKNFVRTMLRLANTQDRIGVVADQVGRPTYAPHLALALRQVAIRLLSDAQAPLGVFHLTGSGLPCSWRDFADAVFSASRAMGGPFASTDPLPASAYSTAAPRPANSMMDCGKIAKDYGIALPNWELGVEECVRAISTLGWPRA